tara:strand:- start:54 stop:452 length:399 start_codon:yes stop_codon:yes gene_type:complete
MALVVKLHPDDLPKKAESLDSKSFKKKVYDVEDKNVKFLGDKPAIVDFYSTWCGPCKMLSPIFDKFADKYKDKIDFYKVNIDDELELAVAFNVMSVPNLLFIPMDSEAKLLPGAPNEDQLEQLIQENLIEEK